MLCHHQCSSQCLCIIPIFSFYDLNCSRIRADCELWRVFSVCSNIPFTYQRTLSENLTLFIGEGTADCQPVKRFVCKQTRLHTVGQYWELYWGLQRFVMICLPIKLCSMYKVEGLFASSYWSYSIIEKRNKTGQNQTQFISNMQIQPAEKIQGGSDEARLD